MYLHFYCKIYDFLRNTFLLVIAFSIFFFSNINSQEGFRFSNIDKKQQSLSFKLINNLIVIPIEINGKKLSFILDSGVTKTILFNISQNDSIGLKNIEKVVLQGLGKGRPVEALLSKNNKISIKNIENNNEPIYVVLKDGFDLSGKMGITINGIIGYNLLKNFIVKINYSRERIEFINPKLNQIKKCNKCEVFPIEFYRKKPYIDVGVQLDTIGSKMTNVKLLVDSGGSDVAWLFEDSKENIKTPNLFFNDILGEGLSGVIYGNRSRIPKIKLKSFEIEKPTVSFLDSVSTKNARNFKKRNGSLGAGLLRKFIVWFDYPNKRLILRKNGSFKKGFHYDMSGLEIVYNGKELVREQEIKSYVDNNNNVSQKNSINYITSFSYKFKPSFRIKGILKGSPAAEAGLLKNDIITRINNTSTYDLTLEKIIFKLQEKNGKKIKMTIKRNGEKMKFEFRLKKRI